MLKQLRCVTNNNIAPKRYMKKKSAVLPLNELSSKSRECLTLEFFGQETTTTKTIN